MKSKFPNKPEPYPGAASSEQQTVEAPSTNLLSYTQILVPIDFSPCSVKALEHALVLAQRFQAKVILLHVVEPTIYRENYSLTAATLEDPNQNLIAAGRERLAVLKQKVAAQGLASELLVRMGRAQSEIPDTAKATGSNLIVMGTHGDSGLKRALLGGTAERVLRQSPCPVLMVRQP